MILGLCIYKADLILKMPLYSAETYGDLCELTPHDILKNSCPINKDWSKLNIPLPSDRCLQPLLVTINNFCWIQQYKIICVV